ncbi:hypothetical protein RhiLY_13255 [Ceratobasidium sp. AG-Ba]|nr:hypothetical protein RhiLY_13255 [Ceratobasidium sp. AG-Ba]
MPVIEIDYYKDKGQVQHEFLVFLIKHAYCPLSNDTKVDRHPLQDGKEQGRPSLPADNGTIPSEPLVREYSRSTGTFSWPVATNQSCVVPSPSVLLQDTRNTYDIQMPKLSDLRIATKVNIDGVSAPCTSGFPLEEECGTPEWIPPEKTPVDGFEFAGYS